jgi:hypothetical protein
MVYVLMSSSTMISGGVSKAGGVVGWLPRVGVIGEKAALKATRSRKTGRDFLQRDESSFFIAYPPIE